MKRYLCVLLILLSIGCTACDHADAEEQLESGIPESEVAIMYTDLSEFLSEEQIAVYRLAEQILPLFLGAPDSVNTLHLILDGADVQSQLEYLAENGQQADITPYSMNGINYLPCIGEFQHFAELESLCLSAFTEAYWEELNGTPMFIELDGQLYHADVAKGSAFGYAPSEHPDTYELISKSDSEIRFNLIGHYKSSNVDADYTLETRTFPIKMVLMEDGWRFSRFAIASRSE